MIKMMHALTDTAAPASPADFEGEKVDEHFEWTTTGTVAAKTVVAASADLGVSDAHWVVVTDDGVPSPVPSAYDPDVGPEAGRVYFSGASPPPERNAPKAKNGDRGTSRNTWQDALQSSKIATALFGTKSGRSLRRRKPETAGDTDVLFSGVTLAAADGEETYVLVNEKFRGRVHSSIL